MTSNTVYVITGANRGLGLGLVQALLARPRTTVVGTVRNGAAAAALRAATTTTATTESPSSPWGEGSVLEIVELDLSAAPTPATVRAALLAGIGGGDLARVDVLVNNAAAMTPLVRAAATTAADLRAAFETNAIAPLAVTQGAWPLLRRCRAAAAPKVVMVSSTVGMLAEQEAPGGAYGASKAALNWLTRALHLENGPDSGAGEKAAEEGKEEVVVDDEMAPIPGLVAFALHPGWVQTEAGAHAAREWGVDMAPPETVEGSVRGMLEVIDGATRDSLSGRFVTYKGVELAW